MLKKWEDLPEYIRIPEIRPYYETLKKKQFSLILKKVFDIVFALALLLILAIPMAVIGIWIKMDSKGSVFYCQERITTYGKHFWIHKFRTMVADADKSGLVLTTKDDSRITRVGKKLRDSRLDELPQLFDVLAGNMSFVGTRPEAVKYVEQYKPEYFATLLLPAGITSEASIRFKDEDRLLDSAENAEKTYLNEILPEKMKWNLESIKNYSFLGDLLTIVKTVLAVIG